MQNIRKFDCLFERQPNGKWIERSVPLPHPGGFCKPLVGGNWGSLPKTIEEERRQLHWKTSFAYDPMQNYPLGQRPILI